MAKIERLTLEQEQQLIVFREQWLRIGLGTGKADIDVIRPIINDFYQRINKNSPQIVRCSSPLVAILTINILKQIGLEASSLFSSLAPSLAPSLRSSLFSPLYSSLDSSLRSSLASSLYSSLAPSLRSSLYSSLASSLASSLFSSLRLSLASSLDSSLASSLYSSLFSSLYSSLDLSLYSSLRLSLRSSLALSLASSLRSSLYSSLASSLRSSLDSSLASSLRSSLDSSLRSSLASSLGLFKTSYISTYLWGSIDAYWIAFYLFPQRHLKADIYTPESLALLEQFATLAQNMFWWYPYDGICFVCDRPDSIQMDNQGLLHAENAPSVQFSDGYAIYNWHGLNVSEQIIMHPETISIEQIENEANAEIRRVMVERYGEGRYLEDSGATIVHEDETGKLYLRQFQDDEPLMMVRVVNSTPEADGTFKIYWLPVHPELRPLLSGDKLGDRQALTARNAVASTFGMTGEQYKIKFES